jgi:hypothetical protein
MATFKSARRASLSEIAHLPIRHVRPRYKGLTSKTTALPLRALLDVWSPREALQGLGFFTIAVLTLSVDWWANNLLLRVI